MICFQQMQEEPAAGSNVWKGLLVWTAGMRRMLGDGAPVLLPPACFLRDPAVSQKLLWEGMTIVQPWDLDDIAPEVPANHLPCSTG